MNSQTGQGSIDITTPEFQAWDNDDEGDMKRAKVKEQEAEDAAVDEDLKLLRAARSDTGTDVGTGWYFPNLENFEASSFTFGDCFQCSPSGNTSLTNLPGDHPIRAIFSLFKSALAQFCNQSYTREVVIRIYCYLLTDIFIIDLLLHYNKVFPLRVILHPSVTTFKAVRKSAKFLLERGLQAGTIGRDGAPSQLLNTLSVRAVNLDGLAEFSSMHRTDIIFDEVSLVGSYNLTTNARKNNWEQMTLIKTKEETVKEFDNLWNELQNRQVNLHEPNRNLLPSSQHEEYDKWVASLR